MTTPEQIEPKPQRKIDDGGPAFPFKCQGPTTAPEFYYGMTLRDYFAAKAMQAFLALNFDDAKAAQGSYGVADAMILARKEQPRE